VARLPPSNGSAPAGLDVAIVRHRWTELKEAVAGQLPRAAIALEAASVAGVHDGELLLAFTNDFLQRTIEADGECRAAIEAVLVEQLGVALRPRCVPAEAHQPALPGDDFLQQAVELFGATGVERIDDESSAGEERAP
jgi:hypothetical protein